MESLQGLVDNRNLNLWNSLSQSKNIQIRRENISTYSVFTQNNEAVIYVPVDNINPASFTHELLHIELRVKQIFISGALTLSTNNETALSKIFSDDLIDHIGNCLDHIKMLPDFIKLGFNEREFLSDYSENKLTPEEIGDIKRYFFKKIFFQKVYNVGAVRLFIAKFFAASACTDKSFSYENGLNELKSIDSELFMILQNFLTHWNKFDCDKAELIGNSYRTFLFEFVEKMKRWSANKTIVDNY